MKPLYILLLILLAGCGYVDPPGNPDNGLIVVFPGIEGKSGLSQYIVDELDRTAKVDYQIVTSETHPSLWLVADNRRQATIEAEKIVAYRKTHPRRPVILIGYSGGSPEILFTLEALPAYVHVDEIVLLSPCCSWKYDTRPALAHVFFGGWAFHSETDLVAGSGSIVGMCDGTVGVLSAGSVGFASAPAELKQVANQSTHFQVVHGFARYIHDTGKWRGRVSTTTPSQPHFDRARVLRYITGETP